mmetsp:Transcript_25014/g.61636  ORF Transcript_25014/g.61636 Transcript_25014/m.61636 type:complete len:93 (-) Transcript_25014:486-764(-)
MIIISIRVSDGARRRVTIFFVVRMPIIIHQSHGIIITSDFGMLAQYQQIPAYGSSKPHPDNESQDLNPPKRTQEPRSKKFLLRQLKSNCKIN